MALLNFGSLTSAVELRDLHRDFTDTRLVVLANRPTPSECRQMLAFGATACLAKSTEARDVLHAIHLASRGLHVLPPAGMEPGDLVGPDLLTPREAEVMELLQQRTLQRRDRRDAARQRRDGPHARAADLPQARGADQARSAGAPLNDGYQASP